METRPCRRPSLTAKRPRAPPCPIDIENVCDGNMLKLVVAHAHTLGVPDESLLLPLLSCVAGFLGGAYVQVNDEWTESCALWTAVVARSGSRRSAVLDRLARSAHATLRTPPSEKPPSPGESPLQLLTDDTVGAYSDGVLARRLALSEDLAPTLTQGSRQELKRTKRGYDDSSAGLSLGGFMRHEDLARLGSVEWADMFSRLVVSHPADVVFKSGDLKTPMAANTPQISQVLGVLRATHGEIRRYEMKAAAKATFDDYYDATMTCLAGVGDDVRYAVLAKAPGQLARLAAVVAALRHALKAVVYREEVAATGRAVAITSDDIDSAKLVLDSSQRTKLAILDAAEGLLTNGTAVAKVTSGDERRMGVKRTVISECEPGRPLKIAASYDSLVGRLQQRTQYEQQQQQQQQQQTQYMQQQQQQHQQQQHKQRQQQQQQQEKNRQNQQQQQQRQQQQQQQRQQQQQQEQQERLLLLHQMADRQPEVKHSLPPFSHSFNVPSLPHDRRPPPKVLTPCSPLGGDTLPPGGATLTPNSAPGTVTVSMMQLQGDAQPAEHLRDAVDEPDLANLLVRHSDKVKKLLQFPLSSKVSPSTCSQRHLMPPIDRKEMARLDMHTRYPVAVAKEYLGMVARLGFGTVVQPQNAMSPRRSMAYFQKTSYDLLSESALKLLARLEVSAESYAAGFTGSMPARSPVTIAPVDLFPDTARFANYTPVDQAFAQTATDERVSPMSQAVFPKEEPSVEGISDDSAT